MGRKTADRRTVLHTGGDIHRGPYRQTTSVYAQKLLIILLGQVGGGIANKSVCLMETERDGAPCRVKMSAILV